MNSTSSSPEFSSLDYGIFSTLLMISLAIGLYFGFFDRKSKTTNEYLVGGRNMKTIPVAMSLIASQISGIALIAFPAEMYSYGTQMYWLVVAVFFSSLIAIYISVPVFYNLELSNAYEYLEVRFDKRVRKLGAFLYLINTYLYIPVSIFIPAMSFSQMTGTNIHLINSIIIVVCVTYTILGGMKAIIWTDVLQAGVILISCIIVVVIAVDNVGGLGTMFQRNADAGRLQLFNMSPSFTERATFWNVMIGNAVHWAGYVAVNQTCVQRFASMPKYKNAKVALYIFAIGFFIVISFTACIGLLMFATYYDCDPIKLGVVSKADKLVSHFVHVIGQNIPGLPGVFIAGVFSASLSTMSAALHSASTIVYQDFVKNWNLFKHTDTRARLFMKSFVAISGFYCILSGLVVEKFGHIMQIINTIMGLTLGITLGIFLLGMLVPWANKWGALVGGITSIFFVSWIVIGSQLAIMSGSFSYPPLPTSIEGCINYNATISDFTATTKAPVDDVFALYKISFNYYALVGCLMTCVVGIIVSFLTGRSDPLLLTRQMFSPCIHWLLPIDIPHRSMKTEENNKPFISNVDLKIIEAFEE